MALDDCLAAGVVTGEDDLDELEGCEGGREEARSLLDFMVFEEPENETLRPACPSWSASLGLHVNFFSTVSTLIVRGKSMMRTAVPRTVERGRWNEDGGTRTVERGRWNEDGGTRTVERGRWNEDGGTRTVERGARHAEHWNTKGN
jgi:hypothetical protein